MQKFSSLALLAILIGCSSSPSDDKKTVPAPTTTATTGANEPKDAQPKPTTAEIPAELKHAGYAYFGLENTKTMDVELRVDGRPTETGGVTVVLDKIENGKAYYTVERTGAIQDDLGTDTVMVDKTGVYVVGTTMGTMTPPQNLQLPADVKEGSKWESNSKIVQENGQELSEQSVYLVKGIKKVKTKVGEYDALLVTSTGTANVKSMGADQKAKYETEAYYVKDRGLVKATFTMTFTGKTPNHVTIEETK